MRRKSTYYKPSICDRCGESLDVGFTISILNKDYICMKCLEEERKSPEYERAITPTEEDFKQVVAAYLSFKVSNLIKSEDKI